MFSKVLIANRGEIALRIHRACHEMGIQTVAIHSTADHDAMHVRLADETICVGPPPAKESYLNATAILTAASLAGVDAIHPGAGFLSENADFAHMVEEHGFTFIGPSPDHMRLMGDKITAKRAMRTLGIPVVPGSEGPVNIQENYRELAASIGYPLLIKAAGGGGGKGMQVVHHPDHLEESVKIASSEAKLSFGNEEVFMEKYLLEPRHIEVQILADHYGNVVHLGERDCSLQRRHQKIWEEAPSPVLDTQARQKLGSLVVEAIKKVGYRGVGTLEFLYEKGSFYFIEMNTRIQVEHPITEMITGLDLMQAQIRVAAGEPLNLVQEDIQFKGHAIECRINAEHPQTFMPNPGQITGYHTPGGYGVRVDSPLYLGYKVPPYYDSLVSKLIVYGDTRKECLLRLQRALKEYVIEGIETILPLHTLLAAHPDIQKGEYDIHWLESFLKDSSSPPPSSLPSRSLSSNDLPKTIVSPQRKKKKNQAA